MDNSRLKTYECEVKFLEALDSSPFETLDVLHVRDRLQKNYSSLSHEEVHLLKECDQTLLAHVDQFYAHIAKVYKWENSQEPYIQWWWHLDKIYSGKLKVNLDSGQVEYKEQYELNTMYVSHLQSFYETKDYKIIYENLKIVSNLISPELLNLYEISLPNSKEKVA